MKVFVSYAATGEDLTVVTQRLGHLRDLFISFDISYHINSFADGYDALVGGNATPGEYLRFAFEQLGDSDVVLVLMTSARRSEGMLMEVGASVWLNKKIILAQHESSVGQTYLPTIADELFVWQTEVDLFEQLEHRLGLLITP